MNLKVEYTDVDVNWSDLPKDIKIKSGFLQEFCVIDNETSGVLMVGKFFETIPLNRIRVPKTLI
jgi:hypothetical protein